MSDIDNLLPPVIALSHPTQNPILAACHAGPGAIHQDCNIDLAPADVTLIALIFTRYVLKRRKSHIQRLSNDYLILR